MKRVFNIKSLQRIKEQEIERIKSFFPTEKERLIASCEKKYKEYERILKENGKVIIDRGSAIF